VLLKQFDSRKVFFKVYKPYKVCKPSIDYLWWCSTFNGGVDSDKCIKFYHICNFSICFLFFSFKWQNWSSIMINNIRYVVHTNVLFCFEKHLLVVIRKMLESFHISVMQLRKLSFLFSISCQFVFSSCFFWTFLFLCLSWSNGRNNIWYYVMKIIFIISYNVINIMLIIDYWGAQNFHKTFLLVLTHVVFISQNAL
jgi:hypothetical protein